MTTELITCPACGFASDDTDDFDVMFACGGNLVCIRCSCEFDPIAGERHDIDTCATCAAMFPFHQMELFTENER